MRILLDSSAYSHLKRGHRRVAELVRASEEVLLPLVVIGELLYGFRNGSRLERNVRALHAFLDNPCVTVAAMSFTTAARYSILKFRDSKCLESGDGFPLSRE